MEKAAAENMQNAERTEWTPIGQTSNTRYYHVDEDIMIVVPDQGLKDNGPSALVNAEFQKNYQEKLGRICASIVFISSLLSQDSEARRVYSEKMNFFAAALIVTNPISRAIGSFFLGLSKPKFPTKLFDNYENAVAWIRENRPEKQQ